MTEVKLPFFDPLKERLRTPLISSFLISWCIYNWRVFVILFFVNKLPSDYTNKVDWIGDVIECKCSYLIPLGFSLFYIFGYPWIQLIILKYTEKRKQERVKAKIEIGRENSVPGDLYYDLKLDFEKEKKKVLEFDTRIKEKEVEIIELTNKMLENEKLNDENTDKLVAVQIQLEKYQTRNQTKPIIDGRWYSESKNNIIEEIIITENKYSVLNKSNEQWEQAFDLRAVDMDPVTKKLFFVKFKMSPLVVLLNELRLVDNDIMEGTENGKPIRYIRRKTN